MKNQYIGYVGNFGKFQPDGLKNTIINIDPAWVECKAPEYKSEDYYRANHDSGIELSVENNTLIANRTESILFPSTYGMWSRAPYYELKVNGGKFIGRNNGEFGGYVSFVPENNNKYRIIADNCCGFYTLGTKIYVLTGLSHLGCAHGCVYEIVYDTNKWKAVCIIDLGSCPEVFTIVDEKVYIAATNSLLEVANGKLSDILVKKSRWCDLYPNSIIYANNSLYIGMRGYVFVFNLLTRKETWFSFI